MKTNFFFVTQHRANYAEIVLVHFFLAKRNHWHGSLVSSLEGTIVDLAFVVRVLLCLMLPHVSFATAGQALRKVYFALHHGSFITSRVEGRELYSAPPKMKRVLAARTNNHSFSSRMCVHCAGGTRNT